MRPTSAKHSPQRSAVALSLLAALACAPAASAVQSVTLFDGHVTACVDEPLAPMLARGQTGYAELDFALRPDAQSLNAALEPYAMELLPAPHRQRPVEHGGITPWTPLCPEMIPEGAVFYSIRRRPGSPEPRTYYPRHPMSAQKSISVGRWMVGDQLVHVEIRARKKRRIIDLRDVPR